MQPFQNTICRVNLLIWAVLLASIPLLAAAPNLVPVGSAGNTLELAVTNTGAFPLIDVTVEIIAAPDWVQFSADQQVMDTVFSRPASVPFAFNVGRQVPLGATAEVRLRLHTPLGDHWERTVALTVGAPQKFVLDANYPNPFNATTTIPYQLPAQADVLIVVYNLRGEVVTTYRQAQQPPGIHEWQWDAAAVSSGVYFVRITAREQATVHHATQKVVLVK